VASGLQSDAPGGGTFEIRAPEEPRAVPEGMQRVDLAPFRREPERPRRDADHRGRVTEVEPGLTPSFAGQQTGIR